MGFILENAVQISSIFSLIAFIAAMIFFAYRRKLASNEKLLKMSPKAERSALVDSLLGHFRVDIKNLTKEQKYNLVIHQINDRSKKFKTLTMLTFALSVVFATVVLIYILVGEHKTGDIPPVLISERQVDIP